MNTVTITDHKGETIGRIWADGPSTIKSEPPDLIGMTRRFLDAGPGLDAPAVVESMRGWSNGYLVAK